MHTEFRPVDPAREVRALLVFDRKVFGSADAYSAEMWRAYESYWMFVDGKKVGCCAFERDHDFRDDLGESDPPLKGTLHITSTGLLPKYQGLGLGTLMKAWQVAFARRHGFTRLVTASRKSNVRMIALNKKFGFQAIRVTPRYYREPVEAILVQELKLR